MAYQLQFQWFPEGIPKKGLKMLTKLCTRGLTILQRSVYVRVTDIVEQMHLKDCNLGSFPASNGLEVRRFDEGQDVTISQQLSPALFLDFSRRSEHSIGYILWQGQAVVGYLWSTDHVRSKEGAAPFFYNINPPGHARYFYDLQVLPSCRLKGAGTALMTFALNDAIEAGKKTVYATRASWNQPMAHVFRKLGFKETGTIELKRVLGIRLQDLRALHV